MKKLFGAMFSICLFTSTLHTEGGKMPSPDKAAAEAKKKEEDKRKTETKK